MTHRRNLIVGRIRIVAGAAALVFISGAAHAAQRCHGTRITRQCQPTYNEGFCPATDSQCRFFYQSTNRIVCYSFQVPCAYDEHTLEGRLGLLGYPIVKTESLPLGTPY